MHGFLAFQHSFSFSQVIPSKGDSTHSHCNIQLPMKIENNSQSSKGLKTNTEMEQCSKKLTCPPPHPDSDRHNFQDPQRCSNVELKNITGAKNYSLPSSLPSNCHPHLERLQSQETEEENEYDTLDFTRVTTPPQQQHQAKDRQEEINTKEEANNPI